MIFLYSALADFGAIFRCILVINQMPTPLPQWHITNTVQMAPQYKFTFNTTESIQTAQDFLQKIIQCLTKPSFSHKMNGWTAQPSHQASVGKGAAVVFV